MMPKEIKELIGKMICSELASGTAMYEVSTADIRAALIKKALRENRTVARTRPRTFCVLRWQEEYPKSGGARDISEWVF